MSDSTKTVELTIETSFEVKKLMVRAETNLLEALIACGISIPNECGGHGTCTTCRIICSDRPQNLSHRTEIESERAAERSFSNSERLACQSEILGPAHIFLPDTLNS